MEEKLVVSVRKLWTRMMVFGACVAAFFAFAVIAGLFPAVAQSLTPLKSASANGEIPVSRDLRSATIYAIPVTRFVNGDPTNDFYCRDRIASGDPHWRGDFSGLISRLDHISDLGFTAIQLTPVVENRGPLDYLGLSPYDWLKVDPRLESSGATYQDLLNAAHARGIKVVQEIVLNHSSNYGVRNKYWVFRLPHKFYLTAGMNPTWPYIFNWGNYKRKFREDNDNPFAPTWFKDLLTTDPWAKGPLVDPKTGTSLPHAGFPAERFFGTDESTLDSNWYHKNGWLQNGDELIPGIFQHRHPSSDTLDLATENQLVQRYLNESVLFFLDKGVDAFVIDLGILTSRNELLPMINVWKEKHPGLSVTANITALGNGYGQLAKPFVPSEIAPWWYTRTGMDPLQPDSGVDSGLSVFDTSLALGFSMSLASGSFYGLGSRLAQDWVYGDPTKLITFFQTRDSGPMSDPTLKFNGPASYAALAYNFLWTARGIPMVPAGDECQFQKGLPCRPVSMGVILAGTGLAYFGDMLATSSIATVQAHPLYKHIQRLNKIRGAIPELQTGVMARGKDWTTGMSFTREFPDTGGVVVVGLAASDQDITVSSIPSGIYVDAVTGSSQSVATSSLSLTFSVKAFSAGIWVKNGTGIIGEEGPFLR
ncbi:MAG: alpha-amylase family glycosyl hydrolase [Candidatus Ozemobacteraceae bacterium]